MGIVEPLQFHPMTDEVDDYRPDSRWAFAVDPGGVGGRHVDLGVVYEFIAPGDRIPLHRHKIDEVVLILDGSAEVRLGEETRRVSGGTTVFIPAGVIHGTTNVGDIDIRFVAVFPSTTVNMDLLERIPAPGTEDRDAVHTEWDMRTGTITILDKYGAPTGEVLHSDAAPPEHKAGARA